ncbi:hypothetical protein [Helicobacter sp. 13S00477-4]|uniref:hypothetical protein n=1 Tax=Helicobacter sp. 13S00477-4 TaxID=1905759 RepID=UPI000BA5BEF5|nr:hypothetical protein [Helicobacter sp. 13S00477-4]PAF52309.1 hypothetical protein BKH44_03105 [Helicobacter sp. 13S00477-4]
MIGSFKRLFFCLFLPIFLFANSFVFDNQDNLLIPKSVDFVQAVSTELKYKTGFSLYVDVSTDASLDSKETREEHQNIILTTLKPPYGIIFFYRPTKKINIILSRDSQKLFDVDQVFFDYIAPLLPEKDIDLTPQRISAIILNGYSEIADRIADRYGVTLENNFPSDNQNLFVRVILYLMLIILIGLFVIVYFFKRGKK